MGIFRRSMCFVLPICVTLTTAAMPRWPVRQFPDLWLSLWLFSAVMVVASCLVSFLVIVRARRLQMASKTHALQENERLLFSLMANLPGMAYRRADDRDGTMEIVSDGGFALTGYQPKEIVRFRDLVHPDDMAIVFPAEGEEIPAGRSFRRQYRLRTKTGGEKWVLEQGICARSSDGKNMSVEGFLFDINDCVAAQDALQQSREKYQAIFENATEGIFQLATDGTLLTANRALAEIFGYASPQEMIDTVNSDKHNPFLCRSEQADLLALVAEHHSVKGFEIDHRRLNGAPLSLSINAHGLSDASDTLRRIDGVIQDITGRKETERLRVERDAAEAASKTKSDFLASIGHEIRTPLNSILGFSQILQAQLGEERLQQYIHAITASGKTLLRLINDILDLSKIEAGKFELQPSAVDLQRVAREIQLVFMPSVDEKQLEFLVDLDPNLPKTIFIDEVRLRQILVNLLKNAFKFTDKGRISLSLRVIGAQPGTIDLEISVADTGIGVPPEDQETIFEAFVQQKRQDYAKYAGTGLGLSITRMLVEILGGRISLHSEVGKGSTFTAVLCGIPVAEDCFNRSPKENGGRNILFDEEAVVLAIDAMDSDRLLIREFLRSTKLAVVETISIADGIKWCMAIKPDLILLDYAMTLDPDPALVQRFNRVKEDLNIPIVVMTSVTGVGSDDFYTDYRFDGWLGKPLLFEDVMRMLARFLPHATLGREDDALYADKREEYALPPVAEVRQAVAGLNDRLPVLRRILVGNLLVQWQEIKETCIINEMKTFAEEIEQMSAEYNLDLLAVWSRVLLHRIRLFDMERVPDTFHLFADLVAMIEECSRPGQISVNDELPYTLI